MPADLAPGADPIGAPELPKPRMRGRAVRDTYLGGVYVCSSCAVRLSECACRDDESAENRYAVWVERFVYDHPIIMPTPVFALPAAEDET